MIELITMISDIEKNKDKRIIKADRKIKLAIRDLKSSFREMFFALGIFEPIPIHEDHPIMTNGKELYYCPEYVNRKSLKQIKSEILHITIHGLLGHFDEEKNLENKPLAWAVMDLKVDRMEKFYLRAIGEETEEVLSFGKGTKEPIGNELYYRAKKNRKLCERVLSEGERVKCDDHQFWNMKSLNITIGSLGQGGEKSKDEWKLSAQYMREMLEANFSGIKGVGDSNNLEEYVEKLNDRAQKCQSYGSGAGEGCFEITEGNGTPMDYRSILHSLRNLAVSTGVEDFPDPIYYTYGMELYDDITLVEPLEEAEKSILDTVVVAVDTSGSCIDKLPVFLRESNSLFSDLSDNTTVKHIWYMECDDDVNKDVFVDGTGDIDDIFAHKNKYQGGGGTDFRPVFNRIAEYEKQGGKVSCLIYYSDCDGPFPANEPDYPCYFILPEKNNENYTYVPDWVTTITL